VVGLCAAGAAVGGVLLLQNWVLAVLGGVCVVATTAELWLPVRYRLDAEGAASKCGFNTSAIRWADVKRLVAINGGVRLSPLSAEGPLEAFRGVVLRFDNNEREVLGKIGELWEPHAEQLAERDRPRA
jgi:hypothetical protein